MIYDNNIDLGYLDNMDEKGFAWGLQESLQVVCSRTVIECVSAIGRRLPPDDSQKAELLKVFEGKWLQDAVGDVGTTIPLSKMAGQTTRKALFEFASGYRLTPRERNMTDTFLELLEKAGALMNDYYSYDREAFMNHTEGIRIFNAVNFFIQHESLSVENAKAKIRSLIQGLEQQFLREKQERFTDEPNLSHNNKCYIEHCAASIGGAHHWCAIAYRYNYWKDMPGAFPDKEPLTVIREEKPMNRINGTSNMPANISKDEPTQDGVNWELNRKLNYQHKRKGDATHLKNNNRDEERARVLQNSKKMQ
ncbi:MAG: hypothetical protein Q9166_007819 [cf. Caloplaca sp. 2 TL-2023]